MSTRGKELLHFLGLGLVHRLRNALSVIQGQAQLLDREGDRDGDRDGDGDGDAEGSGGGTPRTEILAATKRAQGAVQVLRTLSEDGGGVQAGLLLPRLVEVLAVPMQARGLTLAWQHSSKEPPARVNGTLLSETVGGALKAIAEGVPMGFGGSVLVDLCAQGSEKVEILIELVASSDQLPFQIDLLPVQQQLQKAISPQGGLVVLMGRKLSVHLPTLPG